MRSSVSRTKGKSASAQSRGPTTRLPYSVELWNAPGTAPERVLARAANIVIARTVFAAASVEHAGRRLVLRRGAELIQQTD
ncbi:MAG: hypothetical protein JWO33_2940 [Caulobacteraceae bacterium]|nr:hypothetical protein [Caulobacteraceae bacterium]